MKQIRITTKSKAGEIALRGHLQSMEKLPFRQKVVYRGLYEDEVKENPLTLTMKAKRPEMLEAIDKEKIKYPIRAAMAENGADEGSDYIIEVE